MKPGWAMAVWGTLAALLVAGPAISYFKYERAVQAPTTSGQHYAVVDQTLWLHARPDLDDLRLYASGNEIPYTLTVEVGNSQTEQKPLRVLQPGTVGNKTQFLLDMSAVAEYDRVQLALETKDFVAHARVEGQDDPHGTQWVTLGTTTLYDLTSEKLGHNSTLQIPLSAYKYLRVTLDGVVKPSEVSQATASTTRAEKAVWREVTRSAAGEQKNRETVFTFDVPASVPVDRISFALDSSQPNFRRNVRVEDGLHQEIASGEISRIHLSRSGQRIDVEETSLPVRWAGRGPYTVSIQNGDDVPLKIADVRLQQYERRIYFDAPASAAIQLYYGDEKLNSPVYDYRKLFQKDEAAGQLDFEVETLNVAFTGRPDERPWSERHPAVLWAAIIAAVLLLGGLAYRSVKSATT